MSWAAVGSFFLEPVTTLVKGWVDRKKAKQSSEQRINEAATEAKIRRLETSQQGDIAWENTALNNSGIKDEVMMTVILTPMVMCFIPGGDAIVRAGFAAMNESLPAYWEAAFMATVAVSYGLRKWADLKQLSKGD